MTDRIPDDSVVTHARVLLIDALANKLVRDYLAGKLPPLESKGAETKAPALPVKRKAA